MLEKLFLSGINSLGLTLREHAKNQSGNKVHAGPTSINWDIENM